MNTTDASQNDIAFLDASLSWGAKVPKTVKFLEVGNDEFEGLHERGRSRRESRDMKENFCFRNLNIVFQPGTLTLVTGPIASGKSSLLLGLLGEMRLQQGKVLLPRHLGVSYAPQVAWLLNATIKDNILFGSTMHFDSKRYCEAIYACGLEPDLANFAAGDLTEVGERG